MNKYIYTALGTLIAVLAISLIFVTKSLKTKISELAKVQSELSLQNEIIKQNELKLKTYESSKDSIKKNIEIRYREITKADTSCQAELDSIKEVLNTFYQR